MRILYLVHNVSWKGGGIFFTAFHQARHLVARGHDVTLMSISPRSRWAFAEREVSGVRLVESPDLLWGKARTGWDLWDALARIIRLRSGTFDLVHGFESRPAVTLPAFALRRTRGVPVILTWADWFGRGGKSAERGRFLGLAMGPLESFCEEYFFPRADRCITMGEPLTERAVSIGVRPDRILNLLHGCDTQGIDPLPIQEARARLGQLPRTGIVLGYLGALRPTTAQLLLDAFQMIRKQVPRPCSLVLIGNHKLRLRDYLSDTSREGVFETGWISYNEVGKYLAACDLLLLPLKKSVATDNVWPSKLNDYLAAGRPVVATDMRVLEPVFQEHEVGLLTADTSEEFARGCVELLQNDAMREQMGRNARSLAEGDLSWDRIVDRLEILYMKVVHNDGD